MNAKQRNLAIAFLIGLAIVGFVMVMLSGDYDPVEEPVESITVDQDGNKLTVGRNGNVIFNDGEDTSYDTWDSDKVDAFFNYYDTNYQGDSEIIRPGQGSVSISKGGTSYIYVLDDDELADAAGEDAQDPDSGGGSSGSDEGGGGGTSQYFESPTPSSTNPPPGVTTPTPTPYNGGGSSGECLYWRISYCVIKKTAEPTPTPTPGPDANVIESADCGEWVGQQFVPTIISNTLCISEPSPTP